MNTYNNLCLEEPQGQSRRGADLLPHHCQQAAGRIFREEKNRKAIWNNGQAKTSSEEGRSINSYLRQVEATLFQFYEEMRTDKKSITAEALKNAYLGIIAEPRPKLAH